MKGTDKALQVVKDSDLSEQDKNYLDNHINALDFLARAISIDSDRIIYDYSQKIKEMNNASAHYAEEMEYAALKMKQLSCLIEKIEERFADTECENCGHITIEKLRKLSDYIAQLYNLEEDELFKLIQNYGVKYVDTKIDDTSSEI